MGLCKTDTVDVVEAFARFCKVGDELRSVERRTAANREHQFDALGASHFRGCLDHRRRRISDDIFEHRQVDARPPERVFSRTSQARSRTPLSVTRRTRLAPKVLTTSAIFDEEPGSNRMLGQVWKVNGFIENSVLFEPLDRLFSRFEIDNP